MLLKLLFTDPLTFVLIAFPLLYSLVLHEMAHAVVAYRFGDYTAKIHGRFSINPLKHLDPMGTILLLLFGFGWAKPVPINFSFLKPRRMGIICCSLAGVAVNFLIAFACLFLQKIFLAVYPAKPIILALTITAHINLILASFNLIPIPPLDGSRVLSELLPRSLDRLMYSLERYGFVIIFVLLYIGLLDPIIQFIMGILISIISIFI